MNPELTFLVMMSSEGKGVEKDWNLKPGEEGASGELGRSEECAMWTILCGEGPEALVVEEMRER